jgi:DNA-binding winged helix-turn-helix (wHTH) protein
MNGLRRGFAFGLYVVDPVRRLVWYESKLLPVTGKAFELLVFLLDHRDRVVEKDELLKAIWPCEGRWGSARTSTIAS